MTVTRDLQPLTSRLYRDAVRKLEAAGVEQAGLEAQLLLAVALDATRLEILRGLREPPSRDQVERLQQLVEARTRRVPLAYLRGTQEFYGLTFDVDPSVLIPRPETELLVDFAIEVLSDRPGATLVDVGTGSGCLAVAAAVHLPRIDAVALDLSADALRLARRNAQAHEVDGRVRFVRGDLLSGLAGRSADLILSNPPYIPTSEVAGLQPEVRDHEPRVALDGGEDGLTFHRGLMAGARRVLKPGGWLALEVAMGQAAAVAELLAAEGFAEVERRRDLAKIERMVAARLPFVSPDRE